MDANVTDSKGNITGKQVSAGVGGGAIAVAVAAVFKVWLPAL